MSRPAFAIFAQQYLSALLGNFGTVYLNTFVPYIIGSLRWSPTIEEVRTSMSHWLRWKVEADGGIVPVDEISVYEQD